MAAATTASSIGIPSVQRPEAEALTRSVQPPRFGRLDSFLGQTYTVISRIEARESIALVGPTSFFAGPIMQRVILSPSLVTFPGSLEREEKHEEVRASVSVFPPLTHFRPVPAERAVASVLAWASTSARWQELAIGPELYLETIRSLLSQGKVLEARRAAGDGLERYPTNPALRRITEGLYPGRPRLVRRLGERRERDLDWLKVNRVEYRGRWVALSDGELVCSASDLNSLLEMIRRHQPPRRPLIHRVL